MFHDRLELRRHGRVLLIAPHGDFGMTRMRPEFRNNFLSASLEAEWRIRTFMVGDGENERRLLSFWARHVGFGIYPSRLDRIIPEIARRFAVMELADERGGGGGAFASHHQVTIGALDQPISSMGFTEKVALVFQRMPAYLPETAQAELRQLLTPAAIGATVGSVVAVILGGPIVQGILMAVGFAVAGWSIFRAIGDILDFLALTRAATTQADIDAAARKLAAAVSALGIGAIIALLSRGASRAIAQGHARRPQQATRQTQNTQQQPQNTTSQNTQMLDNPTPRGRRTQIPENADDVTRRSLMRENESADILAREGFDVEQNPIVDGLKNPDYRINGEVYDNYAPSTSNPRNIWSEVREKIDANQTNNVILNLSDSDVDLESLRRQFNDWAIDGLGDVQIITSDGYIGRL